MISFKRIQKLSSQLANQIAAGEVVERPASVLKELLENSLDACSSQIEITVERGGIGLLRVQDNGIGICKEDLKLAIAPHATSKIESLNDLEAVLSYGFRGEALASIGSISMLELSSWVEDQEFGWSISTAGRDAKFQLMPVSRRVGTIVEVKNLFYNTPARRKFLRSEKTETLYLEEVFKKIALSHPAVAFKYQVDSRLQKRLPACYDLESQTKRVAALCGQHFVENSFYIDAESNGLKLSGWLGGVKAMRSQADIQYFYVNGRVVRDKVVMHAIREAYQAWGDPGRYPAYVLYFELDPAAVDVNVHPTKHEVRFRETRTVHAFLSYAIQEVLNSNSKSTEQILLPNKLSEQDMVPSKNSNKNNFDHLNHLNQISQLFPLEQSQFSPSSQFFQDLRDAEESQDSEPKSRAPHLSEQFMERSICSSHLSSLPEISSAMRSSASSFFGVPLYLLENELLLLKIPEGLGALDIRLARSLLIKNTLMASYQQEGISKKPLLIPESVVVDRNKIAIISADISPIDWEKLGFVFSEIGENVVLVRELPVILGANLELLHLLISQLLVAKTVETCIDEIVEYILKTQPFTFEKTKELLEELVIFEKMQELETGQKYFKKQNISCSWYKVLTLSELKKLFFGKKPNFV